MEETFTMRSGKIVHFYSALSSNGIHVTVSTKLTEEEKQQFRKELKIERDVVTIRFK